MKFKILGVPVQVDWWFFALLAMLGGALSGAPPIAIGTFVLAGFISVLVHEFGHALSGRSLAGAHPVVRLHTFGGYCAFPGARLTRRQRILMTAAGPGAGFALALLCMGINYVVSGQAGTASFFDPGQSLGPFGWFFLKAMVWINLAWSALNLLPILPMDGGQLLRDFLGPGKEKIAIAVSLICVCIVAPLAFMKGQIYLAVMLVLMGISNFQSQRSA